MTRSVTPTSLLTGVPKYGHSVFMSGPSKLQHGIRGTVVSPSVSRDTSDLLLVEWVAEPSSYTEKPFLRTLLRVSQIS